MFAGECLNGASDRMQPLFGYGRGDVMATPHNTAKAGDIAKTVIMPSWRIFCYNTMDSHCIYDSFRSKL